MKWFIEYRLNHDIQNIIEFMLFYNRMKNTNNEYRRVFYFFDKMYDGVCPNPHGRRVGRWQNIKIHWLNGLYHKNPKKGSAIEWANNGDKWWYYNGQCHREDGPAIELGNGDKFWYLNHQRHRLDGPAAEHANGYKAWYFHDQLHRLDGPAIEYANNHPNEYWEFGKRVK